MIVSPLASLFGEPHETNKTLARVCLRHVGKLPGEDGAKLELLAAAQAFATLEVAEQIAALTDVLLGRER